MERGFIKIYRKAFKHKFWTKARVFSEFEAWIDLLQSARFDETDLTEYVGARSLTYGRGQVPASLRFLAERWLWGDKKVRIFLRKLVEDGSIEICNKQGQNVITICKYEDYNSTDDIQNAAEDTANEPPKVQTQSEMMEVETHMKTHCATQRGHREDANSKKVKKEKKEKEEREKTVVFRPPTFLEVENYCKERQNHIDAHRFIDFYQSKGWMVGHSQMRDWQAAVRRWETQQYAKPNVKPNASGARKPVVKSFATKSNIANHNNRKRYEQF